jgi:multicomponent Na+:H+ antiporter subunit G
VKEVLTAGLLFAGVLAMAVASVGILRLPDLYMRMQAATKAGALGVACVMAGVAVHFEALGVSTRAGIVVVFVFLTAPIAAHLIARAAYVTGVPLSPGSVVDDLSGRYDLEQRRVRSLSADELSAPGVEPEVGPGVEPEVEPGVEPGPGPDADRPPTTR